MLSETVVRVFFFPPCGLGKAWLCHFFHNADERFFVYLLLRFPFLAHNQITSLKPYRPVHGRDVCGKLIKN